jgi:uncharacterized membrane protein
MTRIGNILALLREQLWIVPTLISALAVALAFALTGLDVPQLDARIARGELRWLYSGDASTARDLLSSLLSGLMTMTSLIVSVTFVILTLAANQLGPRLITTFLADRQIQTVLGIFLGTILYVLFVLRSLDEARGSEGVPHVAVTVGSSLTVLCLFALLFYIHKIARTIIVDNVVERVAAELVRSIRALVPRENADTAPVQAPPARPRSESLALGRSGYIQVIDYEKLAQLAERNSAFLRLRVRAGHFVLERGEHIDVHAGRSLDGEAVAAIRSAFVIGAERSPAQDLEYRVRQLVEIGLRGLSASLNDSFTAIAVIDHLGAALEEVYSRKLSAVTIRDDGGEVRVFAGGTDAAGITDAAFDPLRQSAAHVPAVLIRIADVLGQLASAANDPQERDALLRQVTRLEDTVRSSAFVPYDRAATLERVEQARLAIERAS